MIVKLMMIGLPGVGKTHTCIEIAKVTNAIMLDVDGGAEEIIQKLDANVTNYISASFNLFAQNFKLALKSSADLIIIDSLTELKEIIKRHIKEKILQKGEFYIGGVERDEAKKVTDKDLFVLTWELHPPVYDKIRDILRAINVCGKSYIFTYHPAEKASAGEIKMYNEFMRIANIVAYIEEDSVRIKKDRFWNLKELSRNDFVEYIKTLITADNIKETKEFVEGLI